MKAETNAIASDSPAKDVQGDFAQFTQFTDFMRRLVAVPHSQVKARLDEEKRSKKKRSSVSRVPAVSGTEA